MIIFVGDQPSSKNIDARIPFVGTVSYKRLLEWCYKMDIDVTDVIIVNRNGIRPYGTSFVEFCGNCVSVDYQHEDKVIALGEKAAEALSKVPVSYFTLPHPSGRNRKLNDKRYVNKVLKQCKEWLNG